jgi:hypothetical protein
MYPVVGPTVVRSCSPFRNRVARVLCQGWSSRVNAMAVDLGWGDAFSTAGDPVYLWLPPNTYK